MSRRRSDRIEVLAVRERSLSEGGDAWTLRYLLARLTSGTAVIFVIRVHARREGDGSEQCAAAGLATADAAMAASLFRRVVAGCLFPVHLPEVVHDATVEEAAEARALEAAAQPD
jgi:hypothetical protein